jgi:LysM repeat protein
VQRNIATRHLLTILCEERLEGPTRSGVYDRQTMSSADFDALDAPACPYLGLADDRRSHFTFPHPGHRCFARDRPTDVDARHQKLYCVSLDFIGCDRYPASQDLAVPSERPGLRTPAGQSQPQSIEASSAAGPGSTAVVVIRAGDSLARIAARYGLTVEEVAKANGLSVDAAMADGTRLLIPLAQPSQPAPAKSASTQREPGRSG